MPLLSAACNERYKKSKQKTRGSMKKYMCVLCGYIYDEALGWPQDGIAAGTKWDEVPLNWRCPDCGAGKEDFEMIEL